MKAYIFDIDGTLVTSNHIDGKFYKEAILDCFPAITFKKNWSRYKNITDEGLLTEIFCDNSVILGIELRNTIKANFFRKIRSYIDAGFSFESFPGAKAYIERCIKYDDRRIAFATGGWRDSAIMKLQSAGFVFEKIPIFSSDNSSIRTEIMKQALRALGTGFDEIIYFGDATWDRNAVNKLGWKFVAVGKRINGIENYETIMEKNL